MRTLDEASRRYLLKVQEEGVAVSFGYNDSSWVDPDDYPEEEERCCWECANYMPYMGHDAFGDCDITGDMVCELNPSCGFFEEG